MPETTRDYSQPEEAQEISSKLPEADQQILIDHHRELANQLQLTQSGVNITMDTRQKTKEVVSNIVELDSENYGAPPKNSGIQINPKKTSFTEPQAWEDDKGNWFYNFPGAIQLAKALGRTLPNINQLLAAINENPSNFRQNTGYRGAINNEFSGNGEFSDFWSSSGGGVDVARYARLKDEDSSVGQGLGSRRRGLSVRFVIDRK